jgi:hypothetical protein
MVLSGCAAEGERYNPAELPPPGRSGIIYVYRPADNILQRGEAPYITIAGKSYGQLKAGGYIRAVLPEGDYQVTALQTALLIVPTIPRSVSVAVVPGSRSFVRVEQRISSIGGSGAMSATQEIGIEEVDPDTGQAEIARTRLN